MHSLDPNPRPSELHDPMNMTNTMAPPNSAGCPHSLLSPWRSWLLSTVTAGMMFFGYGRYGRAQIVPPNAPCDEITNGGTTVTCTGDLGDGVQITSPTSYTTLIVEELDENIASGNEAGIYFRSDSGSNITINSDTGDYAITTTGSFAFGVEANSESSSSDAGTVKVTHTGEITTSGNAAFGVYGNSYSFDYYAGPVTVTVTGDITTGGMAPTGSLPATIRIIKKPAPSPSQ